MKFLDLNLIESLSHSSGYIRTKEVRLSWIEFIKYVHSSHCDITVKAFTTATVGDKKYFAESSILCSHADINEFATSYLLCYVKYYQKESKKCFHWYNLNPKFQLLFTCSKFGYEFSTLNKYLVRENNIQLVDEKGHTFVMRQRL